MWAPAVQDYIYHEKMAHFNRERIPERIVHAKGSGAFGTFTVKNDISKYTRAKVFNTIGKQTKVFVRFSTVGGEKGIADTKRDPRGCAVKFYTEDGNWDLDGNNTRYSSSKTRRSLTTLSIRRTAIRGSIAKVRP